MFPPRRTYKASNNVDHTILRLNNGFIEVPVEWVKKAEQELLLRATLQLDDVSSCERLAYVLLTESF